MSCSLFSPSSTPPCTSRHTSSYSALHYGCPCPPQWEGGLAKVVNGQPEHVIGAHPCIVNVLQDETLLETNNLVIICLQTHTKIAGFQDKVSSLVISIISCTHQSVY